MADFGPPSSTFLEMCGPPVWCQWLDRAFDTAWAFNGSGTLRGVVSSKPSSPYLIKKGTAGCVTHPAVRTPLPSTVGVIYFSNKH